MNKQYQELLDEAMRRGIEIEKSKYPDWDDNKHLIKVKISTTEGYLRLDFTKEDKK